MGDKNNIFFCLHGEKLAEWTETTDVSKNIVTLYKIGDQKYNNEKANYAILIKKVKEDEKTYVLKTFEKIGSSLRGFIQVNAHMCINHINNFLNEVES